MSLTGAILTDRAYQQVMKHVTRDPDGCWRYHPPTSQRGRPRVTVSGRTMAAYEVVWLVHTRVPVPPGQQLLHSCDNGDDGCVSPYHLRLGTPRENNLDAVSRGRHQNQNSRITECKRGHPFDAENTRIRRDGTRACRTCERERRQRGRPTEGGDS